LVGVFIYLFVTVLLFVARCHYPEDEELIVMFRDHRSELEQLRTMMEYDHAPKFSKSDFLGYEFEKREFTGKFSAPALLDALKACGVLPQPKTTYSGKPIHPKPLKALNYILEDSTNLHLRFKDITLPKEAEVLLRRESPLNRNERKELNRLIIQTAFPDKCPKTFSPEERPQKLVGVIAAGGIPVPEASTAMESLNRVLSGPGLQDKFTEIALPKDAEPLAAQASSLSEGERIKLNRLILQAAFPRECPDPRGSRLWAISDSWALERWLGLTCSYEPREASLNSLGVSNERFKRYLRLLRGVAYKNASIDGRGNQITITVHVAGLLFVGQATFKGYAYRRNSPDPKEIVPSLDFGEPKHRPIFYRHLEGNWYLYRSEY